MAAANPLWRAPRIHGELKRLGIAISERTVSRIVRRLRRPPNQTGKTFLHNHVGQMASTDFFTVPTITMEVLLVFIVLEQDRRKLLHSTLPSIRPGLDRTGGLVPLERQTHQVLG
jgi:hypothetical protein